MAGGGGGGQQTSTTSRAINAQDSYVASEGSILGQNVTAYTLGESAELNITDGGAFKLVENVAGGVLGLVKDLYKQTTSQVASILSADNAKDQEAALAAQSSSNKILMYAIGAALVLGLSYVYKK